LTKARTAVSISLAVAAVLALLLLQVTALGWSPPNRSSTYNAHKRSARGYQASILRSPNRRIYSGPSLPGPIVGSLTTLVAAKAQAGYPIPILPPGLVQDPCSLASSPMTLLEVWASGPSVGPADQQVGLVYNFGIWMSMTPESWLTDRVATPSDLPPLATAFPDPRFRPSRYTDGSVRGHSAWLADMADGSSLDCSGTPLHQPGTVPRGPIVVPNPVDTATPDVTSSPDVETLTPANAVLYFDPSSVSHLIWRENGVLIHLTGPLSVSELSQLSLSMSMA
jgi:hypothetical protein